MKLENITNLKEIYEYQMNLTFPYKYPMNFDRWKTSFENDIDGEGRTLFRELYGKAAYEEGKIAGFVQYGRTAFGFDEKGELSANVSYPVIRMLYFDADNEKAGHALMQAALEELGQTERIYAFFHYFGMSCFARHGKLFEKHQWIEKLLYECGFTVEHENVFYSSTIEEMNTSEINIAWDTLTEGNQQTGKFMLRNEQIGEFEVHYLDEDKIAYLRWIYVNKDKQNQGIGSSCMAELKCELAKKGFRQLDTDTALRNTRAQHYYEKNGFSREGITRSYYLDDEVLKEVLK